MNNLSFETQQIHLIWTDFLFHSGASLGFGLNSHLTHFYLFIYLFNSLDT